ncbi:MAG TPA: hypothetical protein VIK61_05525 [Acidimicrobiia bacterium]
MTETTELKDQLERLAQRGNNPGPEWLVASVRHARAQADPEVAPLGTRRRHALVTVGIAFVAVVVITVAVVALSSRNRAAAPPASTPNPSTVRPVPIKLTTPSVSALFSGPALMSQSEGWVCDRTLHHTVDGGRTWQSIPVSIPYHSVQTKCEFLAGGHAWLGTSGGDIHPPPAVYRIVAGAHPTVTRVELPGAAPAATLASLTFAGDDRGWALTTLPIHGSNRTRNDLYATVDGGVRWHLLRAGVPVEHGLRFVGASRGWAIDGNVLERTNDGGRTWTRVRVSLPPRGSTDPTLFSVTIFGDRLVVAGGRPGANKQPGESFADVSSDNGRTWSLRTLPGYTELLEHNPTWFVAVDPAHWRAFGHLLDLQVTDNAGLSWQPRYSLLRALNGGGDPGMNFVTPSVGWASICKGVTACKPLVVRTTDGGQTWTKVAQL